MEILPISKYNTSPAIIYGYAKTGGISVCRFCFCLIKLSFLDIRTLMIVQVSVWIVFKLLITIRVR